MEKTTNNKELRQLDKQLDQSLQLYIEQTGKDVPVKQKKIASAADVSEPTVSRFLKNKSGILRRETSRPVMISTGLAPYYEVAIRVLKMLPSHQAFQMAFEESTPLPKGDEQLNLEELSSELLKRTSGVVPFDEITRFYATILNNLPIEWMADIEFLPDALDLVLQRMLFASAVLYGQWGDDENAVEAFEAVENWPTLDHEDEMSLRAKANIIGCKVFLSEPHVAWEKAKNILGWTEDNIFYPENPTRHHMYCILQACVAMSHMTESQRYICKKTIRRALEVLDQLAVECEKLENTPYNWLVEAHGTAALLSISLGNNDRWIEDMSKAQTALTKLKNANRSQGETWKKWMRLYEACTEFYASKQTKENIQLFRDSLTELLKDLETAYHKDIHRRCSRILRWLGAQERTEQKREKRMKATSAILAISVFVASLFFATTTTHNTTNTHCPISHNTTDLHRTVAHNTTSGNPKLAHNTTNRNSAALS